MKLLAAVALLALQPQPASAQPASAQPASAQPVKAAPGEPAAGEAVGEALLERFIAVLPNIGELGAPGQIDAGELGRLTTLNPGKEAQVREILEANLACTAPEISAGTVRMLRTVAHNLGEAKVRQLVSFYEGPDYAAFAALAAGMESKAGLDADTSAAMSKMMEAYPLKAFHDQLSRAEEIFAADQVFMATAMRCVAEQMEALEAAGLKSH